LLALRLALQPSAKNRLRSQRAIYSEKAEQLSENYTNFAADFFMKVNNMSCENNNIELPAETRELPYLTHSYHSALGAGSSDKLYYFNANHLGSGSLITDKSGDTYQTLAYAPFGEGLINVRYGNDYDEPYKFSGKIKDEESGMMYFEARYKHNDLNFISTDPMWYKYPSWTPYHYALNNPIMFTDPTGMESEEATKSPPKDFYERFCSVSNWWNYNTTPTNTQPQNLVALDAGHGINGSNNSAMDPGAVGNGYKESDLALAITQSVNTHLQSYGQETSMVRNGELTIDGNSLRYRTNKAIADGANVFVSIHINAAGSESASGFSVLYKDNGSNANNNSALAQSILESQSVMSIYGKGTSIRNDLAVLNRFSSTGAAVLIEVGFISSPIDAKLMSSRANDIGKDIASGIMKFINR
jgi:RHS repeat-associated protein